MSDDPEPTAEKIAARGRELLVGALRPAVEEVAGQQANVLALDEHRLEEIVQSAADRAGGAEWRWALANAASDELGIDLGEAISHPVVERAQRIAGAPPYNVALIEPAPRQAQMATAEPELVRLIATHQAGIANLPPGEEGLELRISQAGLDIYRGDQEPFGRLAWIEIRNVKIAAPRGRRRRGRGGAQLVLGTAQGQASFSVPALDIEALREQLEPLLQRYAGS